MGEERAPSQDVMKMDRTKLAVTTLSQQSDGACAADMSPAECMAAVWPLTMDAWSFQDSHVAQSRFQRHVVRVVRGGR
jgi:hypothetical protein